MRRFVNGEEVELDPSSAKVSKLSDRLIVHTGTSTHSAVAVRSGEAMVVSYKGGIYTVLNSRPRARAGSAAGSGELRSPMPGLIVEVLVEAGDEVVKGQKVLVLEAMKTQQPFVAPFDGTVKELVVQKGTQVGDGELMAVILPTETGG